MCRSAALAQLSRSHKGLNHYCYLSCRSLLQHLHCRLHSDCRSLSPRAAAQQNCQNGAQTLGCSRGAACGETSSARTGTGTRGTCGTSGTRCTRDDAPGAVRAPKGRETLASCDGAARGATGGRCGGAGASAGSRAGTCSRAVVGARPPISRRRSAPRGQASGGARR